MSKNSISKISNAFSSGGGGVNFEQQIQAMFLLSLLIDGFCPAMNERTVRVCFQTKISGNDVDDLAVFTDRNQSEGKLLCQIKHQITVTAGNPVFQEVICAAWSDFNKETFDKENDRIALVTAEIAHSALSSLRFLHAQARGSIDEQDFFKKVQTPAFSNNDSRKMLKVIQKCIAVAKESAPSDEEVWRFCKVFVLLLFDMDCEESVNRALSSSLIKCNSTSDALLVWSRLVEYAGRCNQTGASVDRDNIDAQILELFFTGTTVPISFEPIDEIDGCIPIIAIIGAWREDNTYDRKTIEKVSGMDYSEFEKNARKMLSQNSGYLKLDKGKWQVLHKEELLCQCKPWIFDDCVGRLFEVAKPVLSQKSKRVLCTAPYYIATGSEYDNSYELRSSLVKSICWIKKNLQLLSNCNRDKTEGYMTCLVRDLLENPDWTTWASIGDCLQYLAQLDPDAFLDRVEWNVINKTAEILRLFPQKNCDVLNSSNYISELLWSIEILEWSPDYIAKAICTLGLLEALPYEQTNWVNTPLNSIVSILLPWYPQTLADLEKRKNALKCLKNDDPEIFWKALIKLLPNQTTFSSGNSKPQYMQLTIPDDVTVTNEEVAECYAYLLELAVETVRNDAKKQLSLVTQIGYMYESTLSDYLQCLEDESKNYTEEIAFSIWLRIRERLAIIKPTEGMVIYRQLNRINRLVEKLAPDDNRLKYREFYLGNSCLFEKGDYANKWEWLERKKTDAIIDIYESVVVH